MKKILEDERLNKVNHSCAHLLAQAVKHLYPNAKFWVGPVIEGGFYYDMDLGEEVMRGISDFSFRSWTDFGECNLAAVDFGGTLVLSVCENFYNKEIIKDFIDICNEMGIHFEIEREYEYEQANLRMEKL